MIVKNLWTKSSTFLGNWRRNKDVVAKLQNGQYLLKNSVEQLDISWKKFFLKKKASWIKEIDSIVNKYFNTKLSTTKMTPTQAFSKKGDYVYKQHIAEKNKLNPKFDNGFS